MASGPPAPDLSRQHLSSHAETMVQYRDPGPIVFAAVIERPDGPGAYVTFPFSAVDLFGVRARVPVKARFDDTVEYRGLSDVGACCRRLDFAAHRHR